VDANRRIVGVDALISFPVGPLTTLRAIAHKKTTERCGGGVWGTAHRIKVEWDLDPDIARTRNFRVWTFGGVEFKPTEFELLGVLGGSPGAVRAAVWKRCKHGGALCG
jgi:hypothetical protein